MATPTQTPQPARPTAMTKTDQKFVTVRKMLENKDVLSQIQMALPKFVTPDRFLRIALTTIRRTPALLDCDQLSLLGALLMSAQMGLEPDGIQAALIPYKGEATLVPMYKGYIAMSRRTGEIKRLDPHVVHDGDAFAFEYGTDAYLRHKPRLDAEASPVTHAYCIVEYVNGGVDFEVMSHAAIELIRSSAKAPNSPAWKDHWDEMAKKTVLRRLAKRLPMSSEQMTMLVKAATMDEMADAGISQENAAVVESSEIIRQATANKTADLSARYGKKQDEEAVEMKEYPCSKCNTVIAYPESEALEDIITEHIAGGKCHPQQPAPEEAAAPAMPTATTEEPFDAKQGVDKILNHQKQEFRQPTGGELFPPREEKKGNRFE